LVSRGDLDAIMLYILLLILLVIVSNVNLCALDLSKAFDRMSHHGLFIKMMDRMIPNALLATLEYWFSICETCVRWGDVYSEYTQFKCGVRQGGVLSPYLFAFLSMML
jgi:hypothetical protein